MYAFLPYMELTHWIDIWDKTVGRVCLRCKTDGEANHRLRQGTGNLKQRSKGVEKSSGTRDLHTLYSYVNIPKANHAFKPFTERRPWSLQRFYLKGFLLIASYGFYIFFLIRMKISIRIQPCTCGKMKPITLLSFDYIALSVV